MGGGDLNLKKSWHPQTLRNQEKVWKAQQADLKEKQKLNELEKEIKEERSREDLKKLGQSSGILSSDNPKLEWMYKGPSDLLNREEYLLGRAIDKNFEQLDAAEKVEKEKQLVGVTVPKNHVEHECIPFSIRQYKSALNSEQVDLQRKIMEDPLMLIKQKEMESRRKILENPVKLKELHRLLKMESVNKRNKKKSKKDKKKKTRKEHKKGKSGYKCSESTTDDELDRMLTKQYMKVQNVFQKEEKSANLDFNKMVNLKYEKLSKELDKLLKNEKRRQKSFGDSSSSNSSSDVSSSSSDGSKKYKHKKEYHSSSRSKRRETQPRSRNNTRNRKRKESDSSDESKSNSCDEEELDSLLKKQYMKVQGVLQKDRSTAALENDKAHNLNYETLSRELDKIVKSERKGQHKIRSNSSSSNSSRQSSKRGRYKEHSKPSIRFNRERSRSPNRHHTKYKEGKKSRSRSRSKDRGSKFYNKDGRGEYNSASFNRKKFENRKTCTETSSGHGDTSASYHRSHSSKQNSNKEIKLSEEEKEKRRNEMMENALWRDEERAKKVKKYREEYDKEKQIFETSEFDKTFINKELHKAMSHQKSVESRIKSNINNIQRSSGAMDTNFARR